MDPDSTGCWCRWCLSASPHHVQCECPLPKSADVPHRQGLHTVVMRRTVPVPAVPGRRLVKPRKQQACCLEAPQVVRRKPLVPMVPGVDCLPRKFTPRAIQVVKVSKFQCRQNRHPAGGAPEAAGAGGAGCGLRAQLLHLRRPRHAAAHHPLPGAWLRRCECSELEERLSHGVVSWIPSCCAANCRRNGLKPCLHLCPGAVKFANHPDVMLKPCSRFSPSSPVRVPAAAKHWRSLTPVPILALLAEYREEAEQQIVVLFQARVLTVSRFPSHFCSLER